MFSAIETQPRVAGVEWLQDSVIISFDDGRTAIYSAGLLSAMYAQAESLEDMEHSN
jgi:hypothetical protein